MLFFAGRASSLFSHTNYIYRRCCKMDLFGDLPAAKNPSSGGGNNNGGDDLFGGLPAAASSASAAAGDETIGGEPKTTPSAAAETKIISAAGETSSALSSDKRKSAPSLVSSVGKAGTSLAFVPQAIAQARKKKKVSSHDVSKNNKISIPRSGAADEKQTESNAIPKDGELLSQKAPTISQHEQDDDINVDTKEEQQYEEPYLENEPESIRLLHASVTPENAYNPHYPNDYLAHIERRKTERIQKELQQSALQRLDQQEKLRKKIEEERRKIESSGDVNKIVESRMTMVGSDSTTSAGVGGGGRGRGRRVQNLPAWLVKKQQEEEQQKRT